MTVYRPLVNLITLIGFCGEGNLSAAVDLCAGCNRCTKRAARRLAVRYFVLSCAELCFNMFGFVRQPFSTVHVSVLPLPATALPLTVQPVTF